MSVPTHWFSYEEPTGNGRVQAEHRITYTDGPNEQTDDKVTKGTVSFEIVDVIEGHEQQHDDGSLLLSTCDDETREQIMSDFQPLQK